MLIRAAHDTIKGTIHHHATYRRIDEGIQQKLNLTDGSTAVSSVILETLEDNQYG
jgi:hypothetical protein